jgi:lipoyl(octanoyl) transferase
VNLRTSEPPHLGTSEPEHLRTLDVRRLGLVSYADGLALQSSLVEQRRSGAIGDTLLLLEHPPVITLGARSRGSHTNVIASREALEAAGVEVHDTGRGGDVTYHGPGQLVGYPILDLRPDRQDVHRYVRDLEDMIIQAIATLGVAGTRVQGLSGVWVGPPGKEEKVAAIGVRISRWITSHGFALNVATDLRHFQMIVPCGIADRGVTSLEQLTGTTVPMAAVEDALVDAMLRVFV